MFRPTIDVEGDVLSAIQGLSKTKPEKLRRFIKEFAPDLEQKALAILQQEPGKPRYPIEWASAKQRRYVMMKLRRAGNIPYRRTHAYSRGWGVESVVGEGGTGMIALTHTAPHLVQFIQGEHQQSFHAGRWRRYEGVAEDLGNYATDALTDWWLESEVS